MTINKNQHINPAKEPTSNHAALGSDASPPALPATNPGAAEPFRMLRPLPLISYGEWLADRRRYRQRWRR